MSVLVFIELDELEVKNSSLEAVSYGRNLGEVTAIVFGNIDDNQVEKIGLSGGKKVLKVVDAKFQQSGIMPYASAIAEAFESSGSNVLVMAKSSLSDPVAARVAIKSEASLISNVSALPEDSDEFLVSRSIYTGKASAETNATSSRKILTIKKNTIPIAVDGSSPEVQEFTPTINEGDFGVSVTSTDKTTGDVLLPEADIVVSGGRGLKGPENWGMVDDLAAVLGAAKGCSKPVSDMDWRPHHEHVGQTGIKVSPSLYIAIGISGAIQHLAGVNSSKNILVINKDPEAPFFKAADYGVVGDAFEVVPKLTEAIKSAKA